MAGRVPAANQIAAVTRKSPTASKWALHAVSTIRSGDHRYQTSTLAGFRPVRAAIRCSSAAHPRSKHSHTSLAARMVPPTTFTSPNSTWASGG